MSDHNPGLRPWRDIARRTSRQIMVGAVPVGGGAPISVQTMTNTLTSDAVATIDQIRRCEEAGADLIRVSCPDTESTAALGQIVRASRIPIIADIHFHYKRALEAADAGAACLRINPGNIGSSERVGEAVSYTHLDVYKRQQPTNSSVSMPPPRNSSAARPIVSSSTTRLSPSCRRGH